MVEPVSLDAMKQHLRVDGDTDDTYIAVLTMAARRACEAHIHRSVIGDDAEVVGDDLILISQAMMLLVGGWYANREAVSSGSGSAPVEMPLAVRFLLASLCRQVA